MSYRGNLTPENLCAKREPVWQGLFPSDGAVSILLSNLITFFIQFALFLVFVGYSARDGDHAQLAVGGAFPPIDPDDGGVGAGVWGDYFFADDQVPGPAVFGAVWGAIADVCDAGDLPGFCYSRTLPVDHPDPMTPVVEAFRVAFLGAGTVDVGHLIYSFGFMLVVVFLGSVIFNRVEQTFMDTV